MNKTTTFTLLLLIAMCSVIKAQECTQAVLDTLKVDSFKDDGDSEEASLTAVETFTEPQDLGTDVPDGGFCVDYWKANGEQTCCEHTSLKARQKEITKRAKHRMKQLRKSLKIDITQYIDDLIALSEEIEGSEPAATRLRILKEEYTRFLQGGGKKPNAPEEEDEDTKKNRRNSMFEKASKGKGKAKGRQMKAANMAAKCYVAYVRAQVNTMCLKCSTKGGEFYNAEDETYLVNPEFCTDLAGICGPPLAFIAQQKALMARVVELAKELDPTLEYEVDPNFVQDPAELEKLVQCLDEDCSNDEEVRKIFCDKLNLDGDSPLFYLNAKFRDFDPRQKVKGLDKKVKDREAKGGKGGDETPEGDEPAATRVMQTETVGGYCSEQATGGTDVSAYTTGYQLTEEDIEDDEMGRMAQIAIVALGIMTYVAF